MGAGWDQVRSRGPQFRSESGVDRIIRYLGGGALPAVLETVAVAVHLQDVNVVGEPVKQSAGEPLGAEHVGPLVEGQVGGDQDGTPAGRGTRNYEDGLKAIPVTQHSRIFSSNSPETVEHHSPCWRPITFPNLPDRQTRSR